MDAELSSEVGPVGRLFKGIVDLFWALSQRILVLKFKERQKIALRDEFGRFYFWGDGFYPFEGRLDEILFNSRRLRSRVLSVLAEIGEILCNGKTGTGPGLLLHYSYGYRAGLTISCAQGLFALVNRDFSDEKLNQQRLDVLSQIEVVQQSLEETLSADSDSGSDLSGKCDPLEEIISDLKSRIRCLIDLGPSLDRPAADAGVAEVAERGPTAGAPFKVSGPAEIWTRKIIDSFPNISISLAERFGEANWHRYQRVWNKLQEMDALSLSSDDGEEDSNDEDNDEVAGLPDFSDATRSTRHQSSIFSSQGKPSYGGTTATSISQPGFDYAFPRSQRRRIAKDIRSQATYTSVMTEDRGNRGWLRIPKYPQAAMLGKPFRCTVCGEKLKDVMNQTDWKRHVFADLEPYVCTFDDCKGEISSFATRRSWADHEFTVHRGRGRSWTCSDCSAVFENKHIFRQHAKQSHGNILTDDQLELLTKAAEGRTTDNVGNDTCPFCPERPGTKARAFAMHVARHMEEIALAVLPRDSEFDEDQSSVSSNHSSLHTETNAVDANGKSLNPEPSENNHKSLEDNTTAAEGHLSIHDLYFLAVLGKGNFGKVMLAETKISKQLYAIKIYKKASVIQNKEVESAMIEKRVLLLINQEKHPFLPRLRATFQTETRLYYVMEYVNGGDLMFHVQKGQFGMNRTRFYAAQVVLALKFFHEHGILYRSLKLDDILLCPDGYVKLVDFGLCKEQIWYGSTTRTFCGTPEFLAPEILLDKQYGRAVDWWTLGVAIYQMLLRCSPFAGQTEDDVYDAILSDEPLLPDDMPRPCVSILQKLLTREPALRLGSGPTDAQEVILHPFFENVDFEDIYHKRVMPAFIPTIKSKTDTSNFDPEFTSLTVGLTPVESVLTQAMQEEFQGFSLNIMDELR